MINLSKQEIIFATIVGLIIAFCLTVLLPGSPLQINNSRNLYKEAKKHQDNKDFQTAYNIYSKISRNYPAYDMVLFQESKCAAALENEKITIHKLKTIISDYHSSLIAPLASYNLAQAYIRIKDKHKAEKQFLYTIKHFKNTDFAIGSYYYLGVINNKHNHQKARNYWIKYLELAPDGRFAQESLNDLDYQNSFWNNNDSFIIGVALFKNKHYHGAYNLLSRVSVSKSWFYLAKSCEMIGDYKTALGVYKTGVSKFPSSFDEEQIESSMRAIVRLNGKSALDSWSEIITFSTRGKDYAFYNKAQLVSYDNALVLYNSIMNYYPNGDYASEALWNLFWHEFNNGHYKKAVLLGERHSNTYINKKASPKILFWTAKAYEHLGKNHLASAFYKKVLKDYPDSYYSFRASRRLKELHFGHDKGWNLDNVDSIKKVEQKTFMPYSYGKLKDKYGVEVAELAMVEDFELLDTLKLRDPFINSWIKFNEKSYSESITLARDGMNELMPKPDINDRRWRLIYPIHFRDYITQYSRMNNLNPYMTISLLKEESYFNPEAVSSSNAKGLMQMLPGTAMDIAKWKGLDYVNSSDLFQPQKSIEFGTAYLSHTKELLNNSNLFAVAAYNSGPGAVKNWIKNNPNGDKDQFVENIPYKQTRDYVKKVFGSYWNYRRIYSPE